MAASDGVCIFFFAEEHESLFGSFMSKSIACLLFFPFIMEVLFGLNVSWPFDRSFWCSSILKRACFPFFFISFSSFLCSLFSGRSVFSSCSRGGFSPNFSSFLFPYFLADLFSLPALGVVFLPTFLRSSVP